MPKSNDGSRPDMPNDTSRPGKRRPPLLKEARQWCREARPIFICGPARSGTSILTVSFARHSHLFTPRGVAETFAFSNPQALLATPVRKGVRKYLGDGDAVRRFQSMAVSVAADGPPMSDREVVQLFFFFAGTRIYPGLRPLEKTPSHVSHLDRVFDLFPQARVIVSLRDPVDIVASFRKRLRHEQEAGADRHIWGWLEKSPDRLVSRFKAITRDLSRVRDEDAAKVFLAPYGWVTADPPAALDRLMRFMDLPFEEGMGEGRPAAGVEPLSDDEQDNKRLAEPITARASERDRFLSAEEIRFVQAETAAVHDAWRHPGPLDRVRSEQGLLVGGDPK